MTDEILILIVVRCHPLAKSCAFARRQLWAAQAELRRRYARRECGAVLVGDRNIGG